MTRSWIAVVSFSSFVGLAVWAALASKKHSAAATLPNAATRKLWQAAPVQIEGEVMPMHFNGLLVFLSVMLAAAGAFATLTTSSYLRLVRSTYWYVTMVFQSGLGLGVSTVWCMHFVGMRSIVLSSAKHEMGGSISFGFELGFTVLSAVLCWLFASLAIHVSVGEVAAANDSARLLSAGALLTIGVGAMHYLGLIAERGQFIVHYNVWLVSLSAVVCLACCTLIMAIVMCLPNSTAWRCAASFAVAILASTVHYVGMAPVSHHADSTGLTWSFFALEPVDVQAEATIIVSLFCDVLLMTGNAFYLEVVKVRDKQALEKELEHKQFVADARRLMKKCKIMQFPLALVRAHDFVKLGRLAQHEWLRDKKLLTMLDTSKAAAKLRKRGCIVFFSHQWLSSQTPDPEGHQFSDMVKAINALAKVRSLTIDNIFVWVDYSSIPQCSAEQQQLAINSLPAYVAACSAFVIVAPAVLHFDGQSPCSFNTYSGRFWCRLEVFCAVLTAMGHLTVDIDNGFLATPEMARTVSMDMVPSQSDDNHKQRVYLVCELGLSPVPFMDEDGMQDKYTDLLQVYTGELDCCARKHRTLTGEEVPCDKHRVVQALTGLYGTMLVQLLRLRNQRKKSSRARSLLRLGEMLIDHRNDLFPSEYFGTRIDAMHEYLRNASKNLQKSDSSLGSPSAGREDSTGIDELVADLDEHSYESSSDGSGESPLEDSAALESHLASNMLKADVEEAEVSRL